MTVIQPLRPPETAAWQALVRGFATVVRRLEGELEAEHGLSLAGYDVLAHLSAVPGRRIRMTDLADCALLSRSGLTRLVDRLGRAGLVSRERCEADGRVVYAVLTDAGYRRLQQAYPTHLRGVRRHLVDRLDPHDLEAMTHAVRKLAEAPPKP
jgi:DNA-binding MarR family transcriptional regulator